MMRWPSRQQRKAQLVAALQQHSSQVRNLPDISNPYALETLSMQLIASLRREDDYTAVRQKPPSPLHTAPIQIIRISMLNALSRTMCVQGALKKHLGSSS